MLGFHIWFWVGLFINLIILVFSFLVTYFFNREILKRVTVEKIITLLLITLIPYSQIIIFGFTFMVYKIRLNERKRLLEDMIIHLMKSDMKYIESMMNEEKEFEEKNKNDDV